jgi:hypothetical protein
MRIGSLYLRIAAVDLGHLIGPIRTAAWCRDVERGRDGNPRCNRAGAAHHAECEAEIVLDPRRLRKRTLENFVAPEQNIFDKQAAE